MTKGKRELINTGVDKRYVRRNTQGQIKESDDVGKSLSQDRKRAAKTRLRPAKARSKEMSRERLAFVEPMKARLVDTAPKGGRAFFALSSLGISMRTNFFLLEKLGPGLPMPRLK